ncbi:MAG: 8-oxoguanine DNA glycosylase [Leeuwenhoekiella sp.]|nr:8-oxoguanine DNA glycosylase [Leeuwenhoekiella sp.]|tara:strand:- start:5315 stop:6103 length:789 start_codon:yes stop_codon:yes gene_type:complete
MNYKLRFEDPKVVEETTLLNRINEQIVGLPNSNADLMFGIKWGAYEKLFTPAYWKVQYLMYTENDKFDIEYRFGDNIYEEVVACLLGGFGLKSEVGLAAFDRLRRKNLIRSGTKYEDIISCLEKPFELNGKKIRYRFPNQKSKYITQFLNRNDLDNIPLFDDIELRDWLLSINGIGPKTAAWVTRNYLNSENVAIIDIHIYRALLIMGLYKQSYSVQKDYVKLEHIFLKFCGELDVLPSRMDALIWLQMKQANRNVLKLINQ